MNATQQKAWETHRKHFVVELPSTTVSVIPTNTKIDWTAIFGRNAPLIVEIGSGIGDSLVPMAAARPEFNIIAFEVYEPAVAQTMSYLARENVNNVRIVIADGVQGLDLLIPESSLAEVWTFFADPWPKKRHHKRRLVTSEFGSLVARKLVPEGTWRLATDWEEYALWMRNQLDSHPDLINSSHGWAPRFSGRPVTKFEKRGLAEGRSIWDLNYRRRS